MNPYLKQFAASAIALQARYANKYRNDLYFRTSFNIVALQAGFVAVCIGALWFALWFVEARSAVFGSVLLVAVAFGALLARYTVRPAQETLRNQKLFISNVAHELRTPLSIIKTSAEVSLLDTTLPAQTRKTLVEIIEELNRSSEIINNLLSLNNLTRPERMQFQNIDLSPLLEEVVKRYVPLARERGIKIVMRKEAGSVAWGNAAALEQIMMNTIKNALAYTPKNTEGRVVLTVRPSGNGMVLFCVEDTGVGISQEDLYHIFEPFYRADMSRVRKIQKAGSGLGLTIVNEMVRAHHGKIHIQSKKRKGTTVSIYLPQGGFAAREAQKSFMQSEASIDFSSGFTPGSMRLR